MVNLFCEPELTKNLLNICIIGIGSNIGADENIRKMIDLLGLQVEIVSISSFVKTKHIGIDDQPDFTNGAVKVKTELSVTELKSVLVKIEDSLGRDRTASRYGPRTIDLDIIVWNDEIIDPDYFTRDYLKSTVQELL